jgi:hypothetical protein
MAEDLLAGFVLLPEGGRPEPGLLERRNGSYVGDRLHRREQDLVWCSRRKDGSPAFYLLLEFQSRLDPHMDVRMTTYRGLFCEELIRCGEWPRTPNFPLVLPVVVYNGRRPWGGEAALEGWAPYTLIDVLRVPLPRSQSNLAALLFELERSRTPEAIGQHVARVAELLTEPDDAGLRRAFTAFLRDSLLPARFPGAEIPAIQDLEEIKPMLRETVIEWTHQWLEEGRAKGLKEGRREGLRAGRREGEARLLTHQLERKFGPLNERVRSRVRRATTKELLKWGERIVSAASLDEVFGD